MEHVVSDERLQRIIGRAYRAGEAGAERYTQLWADGSEVVRCRDCKWFLEGTVQNEPDGRYNFCSQFGFEFKGADGFCAWAKRDGAKEAV